jgi:hypothetical protein
MGGVDGEANGCAVGGELLGVSGSQKPKCSSIWVEERLRYGSEMAEYRPRSRPALLLEVINDHGESHCHRTRHRGGRALSVSGCPVPFPPMLYLKTGSLSNSLTRTSGRTHYRYV